MSNKELVIEALRSLPEDVSLEEIVDEIGILAVIPRGEAQADAGHVVSHAEIKNRRAPSCNLNTK